jgi:GT2 family glycosyltransferase
VVIVNYNGRHLLDACLRSVRDQAPAPDRVIVVDNGSSDGSLRHLRAAWPDVAAVDAGDNLGFAEGNNVGIRAALAEGLEYILLLNNDAQLVPGALARLVGALESAGTAAWAAAPKILYHVDPGVIWSAGGRFDWWRGLSVDRGWNERDVGQYDRPELMEFANACCLLVRAGVFQKVGLLDPEYFMYFEDSELAARAGRTGSRVAYVPDARVLHAVQGGATAVGGSSPTALYYWTRNRGRFISRNVPGRLRRLVAHAYVWTTRAVRVVQAAVVGRPHEARLIVRAMIDGYVARATGPRLRW